MPNNWSSVDCATSVSFVPKSGGSYEVGAWSDGRNCGASVYALVASADGQLQREPYPSEPAYACSDEGT